MNYYATGGQAHGLKSIAQDLQDKGRNGDTILAHINPQEAMMLKAAGGSGTINPATGLREFGMFGIGGGGGILGTGINKNASDPISKGISQATAPISKALQAGAGAIDQGLVGLDKAVGKTIPGGWGTLGMAAASFLPGMTPLMMGGLGGLTGSGVLRKGGKFNLQGALMGGAMAYGMANLSAGLQEAGQAGTGAAGTVTPGLESVGTSALEGTSAGYVPSDFLSGTSIGAGATQGANALTPTANALAGAGDFVAPSLAGGSTGFGMSAAGNAANSYGSSLAANAAQPGFLEAAGNYISNIPGAVADKAVAFKDAALNPETYSQFAKGYGENVAAAGRGIANLSGLGEGSSKAAQAAFSGSGATLQNTALPIGVGAMGLSDIQAQEDYLNQQQTAGAITNEEYNQQMAQVAAAKEKAIAAMQANPYQFGNTTATTPEDALRQNPYQFAYGGSVDDEPGMDGLASGGMPGFAMGGQPRFLSGGGDGLSDDISAVIGKDQPARLADGEFVVSSDVVSNLGNGSSKAGAKKLYDMMDRVRQQAHGTKKQIRKVNANKVLPA